MVSSGRTSTAGRAGNAGGGAGGAAPSSDAETPGCARSGDAASASAASRGTANGKRMRCGTGNGNGWKLDTLRVTMITSVSRRGQRARHRSLVDLSRPGFPFPCPFEPTSGVPRPSRDAPAPSWPAAARSPRRAPRPTCAPRSPRGARRSATCACCRPPGRRPVYPWSLHGFSPAEIEPDGAGGRGPSLGRAPAPARHRRAAARPAPAAPPPG